MTNTQQVSPANHIMKRSFQPTMAALLLAVTISIPASMASAAILVPGDLNPGDTYHLAFVTYGTTTSESTNIADYNAFVNLEASTAGATTENYGINWYAIGSTASVDARDNAVVSAPVYLLNETKVAEGYTDMWDGSLLSPINLTNISSNPTPATNGVWTGSLENGTGASPRVLGNSHPREAYWGSTTSGGWMTILNRSNTYQNTMYALSEQLTVPEPSTALLLCLGLLALATGRWNR